MILNEYDIEDAVRLLRPEDTPNIAAGATVLHNLMNWTNVNSDGWPYWARPGRASESLQKLVKERMDAHYRGGEVSDCTRAGLNATLRPIKAFLTKQGVTGQNQEDIVKVYAK